LLLQIGAGEYLAQIFGGLPMTQGEILRLTDLWITAAEAAEFRTPEVEALIAGNSVPARARLMALMRENQGRATFGATGLDDELAMFRDQLRSFSVEKVIPLAHEWHLKAEMIPMEIVRELSDLGVFGLTIPGNLGGLGLSKASMVVVSEEL